MTNLIPSGRRLWITRGRVLVGLPIVFGVILTAVLGLVVLRPVFQDVQELERRRDSLLELQRNLPGLVARLEQESIALGLSQDSADAGNMINSVQEQDQSHWLIGLCIVVFQVRIHCLA